MGYTHYASRRRRLPLATFKIAAADCRKVVETLCRERNIEVHLDYETPEPAEFSTDAVCFNGVGDDGHETFLVERFHLPDDDPTRSNRGEGWFDFIKTNRKPYDPAVCACLIVFHHHFGKAYRVSSDGDDRDEGWVAARECCQRVLGYGADFTLKVPPKMTVHGLAVSRLPAGNSERIRHLSNGWRIIMSKRAEFRWMVCDPNTEDAEFITGGNTIRLARWKATIAYFQVEFSEAPFLDGFVNAMQATPGEWSPFLAWSDKLQDHGFDAVAKKVRDSIPR